MSTKLQSEIKQGKPFSSLQEELWLNLSRTSSRIGHTLEQKTRLYGLSPTQYNVLRILRGAGTDGLSQTEIGDRLVAQVPDVPRILDRMEKAGWVKRERGVLDRRVVMASVTEEGLRIVGALDEPLMAMMQGMFLAMNDEQMAQLNCLLELARG